MKNAKRSSPLPCSLAAAFAVALAVPPSVGAESLPPAVHDRGGVTFDFAECSARRFGGFFDKAANVAGDEAAGVLQGGGKAREWNLIRRVPLVPGKTYRASIRCRKGSYDGEGVGHATLLHLRPVRPKADGKGHESVDGYKSDKAFPIAASGTDWADVSGPVTMPEGATLLTVQIRRAQRDDSTIEYKDLVILEEASEKAMEIKLMAMGNLDGRFFVGEGQSAEIECFWRMRDGSKPNLNDLRCIVDVPAGVELLDATSIRPGSLERRTNADGSSTVSFVPANVLLVGSWSSRMPVLLLKATGGRGPKGKLSYRVERTCGKRTSLAAAAAPMEIVVCPPVKAAAVPARYANGAMFLSGMKLSTREGIESFSRTLADMGVTWMVGEGSEETYALWRRLGVRKITPTARNFVNGFYVSSREWVPKSDRWVPGNLPPGFGHADYVARATCPVSIYSGSDFFRTNTVPYIKGYVKGADGCWSNWEPFMFRAHGCFCGKCCRAFAKWVGRPYDEVAAGWPTNVMAGGEHFGVIQKFRSLEHAKVVKTIDRVVREATGGEKSLGFIPGICWIEMGSWWRPRNYAAEVQAIDYAGSLRWMDPWGPYAKWASDSPYVYSKRSPVCHFFAARDVRETVDADYLAASRPKLMALPHAFQSHDWVTQPEHIGMAMDCFFFWGWESSVMYFFPRGYDARFYRSFADATERAAKYEGFVLDGRRIADAAEARPVDGLYAADIRFLSGYLPACTNVSPLQCVAYEKDGSRIVAVFNFWQKGEAFFDLRMKGLDPSAEYTLVSERGVLRAKSDAVRTWTGAELAKGVRLAVGAARTCVFEVRPASVRTSPTAILTDAALDRVMKARASQLRAEAERDAEAERGRRELKGTSSDKDLQVI